MPEAALAHLPRLAERAVRQRGIERELQHQRVLVDSLLDRVASLVVVLDPAGRIVRFNRACVQASGWSEHELRGRPFWDVLRPQQPREEIAGFYRGDGSIHDLPAALDKPAAPGRVNAYVCRGVTCLEPVSRIEALRDSLGPAGLQ